MKLLITATLSVITLSSLGASAFANKVAVGNASTNAIEINPANLVEAAYQGRFIIQGIPSSSGFLFAIRGNRIKAEDLAEVAVSSGRLSPQTLRDGRYLESLQDSINNFKRRRL